MLIRVSKSVIKKNLIRFASTEASRFPLEWSYIHCPSNRHLENKTVGQILDSSALKYPSREALVSVHQGVKKTFEEVREDVVRLSAGFSALGLRPGDRIGIWGPNSYQWYLTQFAAMRAGLVLVNINPAYQPQELLYCLNKVGVKAVVAAESFKTQNYYEMLEEIAPEISASEAGKIASKSVPKLKNVIMISEKQFQGAFTFDSVANFGGGSDFQRIEELQAVIQPDDPCNIQFTSGTTGSPKGATLSHHNIVNNARFIGYRMEYDKKVPRLLLTE